MNITQNLGNSNNQRQSSVMSGRGCNACWFDYTENGSECCDTAWNEYGRTCAELYWDYNWNCGGCNCPGDTNWQNPGVATCEDTPCGRALFDMPYYYGYG